jgi:hypothetical protein
MERAESTRYGGMEEQKRSIKGKKYMKNKEQ